MCLWLRYPQASTQNCLSHISYSSSTVHSCCGNSKVCERRRLAPYAVVPTSLDCSSDRSVRKVLLIYTVGATSSGTTLCSGFAPPKQFITVTQLHVIVNFYISTRSLTKLSRIIWFASSSHSSRSSRSHELNFHCIAIIWCHHVFLPNHPRRLWSQV